MDIQQAQTIIGDLQAKRAAVNDRRSAIDVELRQLGYAAHVENDTKAQARIAKLNTELATLGGDEISIDAALAEAGRRLADAQRAAEAEAEAARVAALPRLDAEHAALGEKADAALAQLVAILAERRDIQGKRGGLGDRRPRELQGVNDRRAVETALMTLGLPWPALSPDQRITFAEMDGHSDPMKAAA